MYLKQTKRNGRVYLSVMQNYRHEGKVRSKTIESIGYADEFANRYDDPIAHFKAYVDELNEKARESDTPVHLTIARGAQIATGETGSIQLGSAIALGYLDALGIGRFFNERTPRQDPDAGLGRAVELLVTERMLHAVPVHETWSARAKFPRACKMELSDVYRGFEQVAQSERALVKRLNGRYETIHGPRALDSVRLVLSNYVFPWPKESSSRGPDEMEGQDMARLWLAIDGNGIPLTYRIVPRDMTAERTLEAIDELKEETGARHITLVAAQLEGASTVVPHLLAQNDGFVLLIRASEMFPDQHAWVGDESGYALTRNGAFLIKSRVNSLAARVSEVGGSAAYRPAPPNVEVREVALRAAHGKAGQSFVIATNELVSSNAAIFNIYRELWRVHEPFQVITADFIAAPYPVDARVHLRAHFAICYAAFFALRMLREDMGWQGNAAQVADALVHMEGAFLDQNWYLFNYRTPVTDNIQRAVGIEVGRRLLSRGDIRSIIARVHRNALHEGERERV